MPPLPLIAPNPPRLSEHLDALRRVEASGVFSNNGPEVRAFEAEATERLFDGRGACLAVANATLGLMIAIRDAGGTRIAPGTMALMPALTFAATAHAAMWAGLTPLVCDIDPDDWGACAAAEERLLAAHGARIGVIVPYATFGNAIDLDRYAWLATRHGVGVVIDAAASLGTRDAGGRAFGADARFAIVHSMHATKTFAVAEGGLIHSADTDLIDRLRAMTNFGFGAPRSATMPGLNAKLPEILAIMARAKLAEIDAVTDHRAMLEATYRTAVGDALTLQRASGTRRATQFMPVLLPRPLGAHRPAIVAAIEAEGIGCGQYFSPHLGQQPWFRDQGVIEPTPVADDVAGRMLSLPITDAMVAGDVGRVVDVVARACSHVIPRVVATPAAPIASPIASVVIVGGGPAGTAILTAASKHGLLGPLARDMILVERDDHVGGGRLGGYAITSDSTAQTFLTAVRDNPYPRIAALADHPVGRTVDAYRDALGVPLADAGPLLRETGQRLASIVRDGGGTVLTGHEAISARRHADGLWSVRLRRLSDGQETQQTARAVVIATGGHQPPSVADRIVAGESLGRLAGDRLVRSDELLTIGGLEAVTERLASIRTPRVAVVGGSTSALTSVALLLKGRIPLGAGALTLLHRRPLRPFYPSIEAARNEGFTDFGPDDICPVSGFVYRLAGFRLEARELVLRLLGVDGRVADPRVASHRIAGDADETARRLIREADLVVAALGYRPHALPIEDAAGTPLPLAADQGGAMVDRHCRVRDAGGSPIPGLYGIGLAAGFVPWGRLGGEPSFVGQANGLWLWQNDVGLMIVDQLLGRETVRAAA
ncbi:DegT/DnrJ/EryC1/StrS family aminotransferase [uncultured Sphingomonas sp.]|uniref:DegT/DnrJ/EryC1/StrS family aminotransferase n=1 Tax=uncultured Sphingomonas sp. TaxID=158754 RepID=UPI00260C9830|nr:DegT/DnrJ/EryC1/StrS family aminotransferase [uncultured Sphingomonas sp.]